ncbi:homoaconitate hydratase family protein [Verminephrobacter aporrectodeae subsp. tuberculatae]|uniref:Homoaconitate hydratase family protein n=2 Tax=Verminephrobacter TaxID=364316 RepID=A0ABT3L0C4_9BURK|nr:homoaconitate hydratase family protein [Verminephrobacter aporrectodeae subsp. tuberculatae]
MEHQKMNGLTIAEKILSRAARRAVRAGDIAICTPDLAMGTDGSIPMALDCLDQMLPGAAPFSPSTLVFAFDHYDATSGAGAQALQQRARRFAQVHGIAVVEVGEGIGHQCILESGAARPGRLMVGADSHATSYGAANAFATGIGSSDLAGIMLCGQLWLKVPESMRVVVSGNLAPGVCAKDIALTLARRMGSDGANYRVLEFQGPGVATLDMDDRIVLANMAVELGAKAGIFPFDGTTQQWLSTVFGGRPEPEHADADAHYADTMHLDLASVVPQIALPHRVDNVIDLQDAPPTPIDMVYLGTCTGGRVKDYREALDALQRYGRIAPGVRLVLAPASESVRRELERSGMLDAFVSLGAELRPPGCGSCCGTCGTAPSNGQNVASTANRNFKGRMGNAAASIFLASPRACATMAATGVLCAGTVRE